MIDILLIDDNVLFCKSLQNEAKICGFNLEYFHDLDTGINALLENIRFKFLILDDKCKLHEDQQESTVKGNFIAHALMKIEEIEHTHDRRIPFCVIAEESKEVQVNLEGISKVFGKGQNNESLFKHIVELLQLHPEIILRQQYSEVFKFSDTYLSSDNTDLLIQLFDDLNKQDSSNIVSNLVIIRRLLEQVCDLLATDLLMVANPENLAQRGRSRTRAIADILSRQRILTPAHNKAIHYIYSETSKYGNHSS